MLWQQLRLPRRLARGDVDLFWSPLITLPLRCPVPAVVTVHDLTALLFPEAHTLKVRLEPAPVPAPAPSRRRGGWSPISAGHGARTSPSTSRSARRRSAWSTPGSIPSSSRASATEIAATRRELGAPEGYVLYAGTLEPRKNVGAAARRLAGPAARTTRRPRRWSSPAPTAGGASGWRGGSRRSRRRGVIARSAGSSGSGWCGSSRRPALFVYPSLYEGFGLPAAGGARLRRAGDRLGHLQPARGGGRRRPAGRPRRMPGRSPAGSSRLLDHPARAAELGRARRRAGRPVPLGARRRGRWRRCFPRRWHRITSRNAPSETHVCPIRSASTRARSRTSASAPTSGTSSARSPRIDSGEPLRPAGRPGGPRGAARPAGQLPGRRSRARRSTPLRELVALSWQLYRRELDLYHSTHYVLPAWVRSQGGGDDPRHHPPPLPGVPAEQLRLPLRPADDPPQPAPRRPHHRRVAEHPRRT